MPAPIWSAPSAPVLAPFLGAAGAIGLAAYFVSQGRVLLMRGSIERRDRPGLFWTLVVVTGGLGVALLAVALGPLMVWS